MAFYHFPTTSTNTSPTPPYLSYPTLSQPVDANLDYKAPIALRLYSAAESVLRNRPSISKVPLRALMYWQITNLDDRYVKES